MDIGSISPSLAAGQRNKPLPDAKAKDAAQQFESLLIGQMMKSMHQSGSGWLGTGEDQAGQSAMDFAEEQFATAITKGGGLGLSKVIETGLKAPGVKPQKLQD